MYYYVYKICFVDGCFYYGSRKSRFPPEQDKYFGSPVTFKEKWLTTHYWKEIVEVFSCEVECSKREVSLIAEFRESEHILNANIGGRIIWSPQMIELQRTNYTGERNPRYGIPVSTETRGKIGLSSKMRWEDPEYRRKMTEKNRRRFEDPEERRKMSELVTGKINSEEHNRNIAKARTGKMWITDGVSTRSIPKEQEIPKGWRKGKTNRKHLGRDSNPRQTA